MVLLGFDPLDRSDKAKKAVAEKRAADKSFVDKDISEAERERQAELKLQKAKQDLEVRKKEAKNQEVVEKMFKKADTNGDGTIDKKEFAGLCKELGYRLTSEEAEIAFKVNENCSCFRHI